MRTLARACAIIATTVVLLEAALRVWNPLPVRLRGDQILLPAGATYTIRNPDDPKLDRLVVSTRNSLGFRGPEVPRDFASRLSIVTVGGSTTECLILADDKTWPAVMAAELAAMVRDDVWVNNAGVDGQSTIGHMAMLDSRVIKLHPRIVLFLTGRNDVGLDPAWLPRIGEAWRRVARHSEVANVALNIVRARRGRPLSYNDIEDGTLDLRTAHREMSDREIDTLIGRHASILEAYRSRLAALIDRTQSAGIRPIFMTQPMLFGDGIDPTTGVSLATIVDVDFPDRNGKASWRLLDRYNDVLRGLASARGVELIDLARLLPKDSRFFIDEVHYSNDGAAAVGRIVARELAARLAAHDGV